MPEEWKERFQEKVEIVVGSYSFFSGRSGMLFSVSESLINDPVKGMLQDIWGNKTKSREPVIRTSLFFCEWWFWNGTSSAFSEIHQKNPSGVKNKTILTHRVDF
jgi:hypothetical protein